MIVPWIKGFISFNRAPLTWTLILLNFFFYVFSLDISPSQFGRDFSNVESLVLTGKLYHQFRGGDLLQQSSQNEWMIMGGQGLKDPDFVSRAPGFDFTGDEVAIIDWKKKLQNYHDQLKAKPSFLLGLRTWNDRSPVWLTYQFMHASWMHLFSNMIFLLIFGAALELMIGSLAIALLYVLSGFAGALLFLSMGDANLAPMIGASGSLSGIMAFFAAYEKKRRVKFFYFLSPFEGYFGWIYLPTLLILPMYFLSDLASLFASSPEIGDSIAYAAHLGGALFGLLAGFVLRNFRRNIWVRWISQH
jgi:membrane associated rhomboid family serine protease